MVCITIPHSHSRDFTLEKYRELCEALRERHTITTVSDYLSEKPAENTAILRHDIDRKIGNALRMAELEYGIGIHSTYYFRYPHTFKPEIIRKIRGFGHETGYHYEVLSKTQGDYEKAIALFQAELEAFRKVCPVDTICMHGQPLSPVDNRDLWKRYDFRTYGLKGEAYLSMGTVDYFTDTGRSWSGRNNLSDFIGTGRLQTRPESTDELIQLIQEKGFHILYLTTHPERWSHSPGSYLVSYGTDFMFNTGKMIIRGVRR